jgi:hypothetical protein
MLPCSAASLYTWHLIELVAALGAEWQLQQTGTEQSMLHLKMVHVRLRDMPQASNPWHSRRYVIVAAVRWLGSAYPLSSSRGAAAICPTS